MDLGVSTEDLLVTDTLPEIGPLILCGEPGLGKSTELANLVDHLEKTRQPDDCLLVTQARAHDTFGDLRAWLSTSPEWQKWSNSNGRLTIVIDGVDEGMIRIPLFVTNLKEFLRNQKTHRIRLILCCRSAEWPDAEGKSLIALWPEAEKTMFELRQLRREDARIAAESRGYDGDAFLKSVTNAEIESLAARPITLLFLLDEFHGDKFRTTSHRKLYENGCYRFCQESNPTRITLTRHQPTSFTAPEEKLASSKRLALLFLLGGKSSIHCPAGSLDRTPPSALSITEIAKNRDSLTENSLIEALRTGIFTSKANNLFTFTHQTFAECLAGQALSELPLSQLKTLLCGRDHRGEYVIPQLSELASWTAEYHQEFFEFLMTIDPSTLLRCDASSIEKTTKSRLIARILEMAQNDEFFDDSKYNRFWRQLDHPNLPSQITDVIFGSSSSLMARRVATAIAEECHRTELIAPLRSILDDHGAEEWLRKSAANALCKIMPDDRLSELEPLARREVGPDPNHSICGYALKRLVPSRWTVAQSLPWIKAPTSSLYFGSYRFTIEYHLSQQITDSDLIPSLQAIRSWRFSFSSLGHRRKFSLSVLFRSLERIDDPKILQELVKLWRVKSRNYRDFFAEGRRDLNGLESASDESRLAWASGILNDPETDPRKDAYQIAGDNYKLINPSDIGWLLRQLPNQPKDRIPMWIRIFEILRWSESELTLHWDLFIQTLQISPELREAFSWFTPTEINSKEGRSMKARWVAHERLMGRRRKNRPKIDHEIHIAQHIEEIHNGNAVAFLDLCCRLSANPGQSHLFFPLSRNIAKFPGWTNSSEERQSEIRQCARIYLLKHSDKYDELGYRAIDADCGLIAINLLLREIEDALNLQQAIVEKWIDSITGDPSSDSDLGRKLFSLAYRLNPKKTIAGWLRELKTETKGHKHLFALRHAAACFDSDLATAAINFIETCGIPESVQSGIQELNRLDSHSASEIAVRLIKRYSSTEDHSPELFSAAVVGGLDASSVAAWTTAYPILRQEDNLAIRIFLDVAHYHGPDIKSLAQVLGEEQLADLYLLLCRLFPRREDPEGEDDEVTQRQSVIDLRRGAINELASRSTEAACEQLIRLAQELPEESTWLLWRFRDALQSVRRKEWDPISINQLTSLVVDGKRRFLRNEDDLQEIIIESLNRFQRHLRNDDLPAAENFWHWDGGGQKRTNFRHTDEEAVSDHIARWLRDDIGPSSAVVVNREVQPQRGKRTDITVQAWSLDESGSNQTERPLSVTIEVKGCWNPEVTTGAKNQLLNDYLVPHGRTHGIFLVGWFYSPGHPKIEKKQSSKLRFTEIEHAWTALGQFVEGAKLPGFRIEPFILDVRIHQ